MKKILILLVASVALIGCQQKTAYVSNQEIMEGFEKLKEAEEKYVQEEEAMKAKMDAMVAQSGYQDMVQEYQANQGKMSKSEEEALYNKIMQIQQSLGQQQQMNNQQFQQKKNAEMDSLVKTVKDFVKSYGKDNGYTFIYGSNESGNILYGKEELDITEEVTQALNAKYPVKSDEDTSESTEDLNPSESKAEETTEATE
jgi:outer membrane protein